MSKIFFLSFVVLVLGACKQQVVQYPVTYSNDDFMKRSQEIGKALLEDESKQIEAYINKNGGEYTRTSNGFWISNKGKSTETMAKSGDYVIYSYEIKDLNDQVIYPYKEIGQKNALLGKTDLNRGLHASLQLIEKGDSATALMPSFLAYGGYGDQNKIGSDEPIVMKIKVLDIRKKN